MLKKASMKGCGDSLFHTATILQKYRQDTAPRKNDRKGTLITVRARPGNHAQGLIEIGGHAFPCALGRGGISGLKREGDGATPLGAIRPLAAFHRTSGIARTPLRTIPIHAGLGWCDAPDDRNYNRPVRLPYSAGHEKMLRDDGLYDICVVLDWNMTMRRRGCGSAIFLHMARPGMKPTEGCIAVTPRVMARLLPLLSRRTVIRVLR